MGLGWGLGWGWLGEGNWNRSSYYIEMEMEKEIFFQSLFLEGVGGWWSSMTVSIAVSMDLRLVGR